MMGGIVATFLGLPAPLWQSLGLTLRLAAITTLALGLLGLPPPGVVA